MSDLHLILCMLSMSVDRSSSGDVATSYVLPVLWMASCLYIGLMARRRNGDSIRSSMDLSPWRILKLTHQGAAPDRGRSLISTIPFFAGGLARKCPFFKKVSIDI